MGAINFKMLFNTIATEESLVSSQLNPKILRRPNVSCQITTLPVGLLRMTDCNHEPDISLTHLGKHTNPGTFA